MGRTADPMPFSPQYSFEVFRAMKFDDHEYVRGDAFPAEGKPAVAEPTLRKLYTQKRIIVTSAPDAADLKPGTVQAANLAAGQKGESSQADGTKTENPDGTEPPADDPSGPDAPPADDNAPPADGVEPPADAAADQQPSGDAGDGSQPDGPVDGARPGAETPPVEDAKPPVVDAGPFVPVGPLKRIYRQFSNHDVVDANGVVLHKDLSKADADAIVAKGL